MIINLFSLFWFLAAWLTAVFLLVITWFQVQFDVIKHKDNKIAWAGRASAICSLWKFTSAYYTKFQGKLLSLVDNAQEKTSQKDKTDKIWKHAHAIYNLYSLELHENAFVNQPIRGA